MSSIPLLRGRTLTRSSVILIASNLAGAALGFVLSIAVGRGLGEVALGNWTFCLAWAAILTALCEFGLDTLLTRDAARSPQNLNQLLMSSLAAKAILVTLTGGSMLLLAPELGIDPVVSSALRVVVLVTTAGCAFGSFSAVFRAQSWMEPILALNVGGLSVQLLGSIWIIRSGGGVLPLIWMAGIVDTAQLLGAVALWYLRIRKLGGELNFSRSMIFQRLKQALPFALAGAIGSAQLRSGPIMLGYLRGPLEVGWFGAASRFSEAAKLIPYGIFGALYPVFASEKDADHFNQINSILNILAAVLALGLCLLASPILLLSYGTNFLPGVPILVWLGVGILPSLSNGTRELYLYAVGDEAYANGLRVVALVVQLGAGVILVSYFGGAGLAVSLLLGEIAIWFPLRGRMRQRLNPLPAAQA